MSFEVLGPLRVVSNGRYSFIRARKVETILAILLIRSNEVVTPDQLIDELWGAAPPRRATAGLHVYISQLRKFLQQSGMSESIIETRMPGYMLHTGNDDIDFHVFLKASEEGRSLIRASRYEQAAEVLSGALTIWRGAVLSNVPAAGPLLEGFATWLSESRLECMEALFEAKLGSHRHREIVGTLYSAVAENPLRETFYRQLMLALYRSERQADSLAVFRSLRKELNEELGLEPCRTLRELHQAIVVGDDRLLDIVPTAAAG